LTVLRFHVVSATEAKARWRARRNADLVCVGLEVPRAETASALARRGLLQPLDIQRDPDQPATPDERATLQRALQAFVDRELFGLEPLSPA
jgi:hypothetical protein